MLFSNVESKVKRPRSLHLTSWLHVTLEKSLGEQTVQIIALERTLCTDRVESGLDKA